MTEPESAEQKTSELEVRPKPVVAAQRPVPFAPIVGEHHVGGFGLLYRRQSAHARVARVFMMATGGCLVYPPDKQPTLGELLWKRIRTVYEVDIGVHMSQVEAELPSAGDAFAFRATIDLVWQVNDPAQVVVAGVADIGRSLSPFLLSQLRAVTRQFEIADAEAAEVAANKNLRDTAIGTKFGLSIEAFVRLSMDESSLEHAARRQRVDHFRSIIAAGDFNQFALQLAMKPDDIGSVVDDLMKQRDDQRQAVFNFVTSLLESDVLDRWQIDDQVRIALRAMRDEIHQLLARNDRPPAISPVGNSPTPISGNPNGAD